MYADLKASLDRFRALFPTRPVAPAVFPGAGKHDSTHGGSTATITTYDAGFVGLNPALPFDPKLEGR